MAVSQIEEKILGRLAKQTGPSNALLSSSIYQVLGLSILLSRKLYRARKLRKLDITRDTKSLQLYHHIIWLAREGLSITEVYILPYCQNGEQGPECRVMAAKLRASFYHIFCLFHNHPSLSHLSRRSSDSDSTLASGKTPKTSQDQTRNSPSKSPRNGREGNGSRSRRRSEKSALRDPIPSMTSDASYVTNPFAGPSRTPPTAELPQLPPEARRTPTRPPGLTPIKIPAAQAAVSFLIPPLNFVPMAKEHFDLAQTLANSLLAPTHALRLSVALERAAFIWDCEKDHERAKRLARRTIKEVYASSDGLDDEEFADASILVQALGGIVKRGSNDSTPRQDPQADVSAQRTRQDLPYGQALSSDQTVYAGPSNRRRQTNSPSRIRSITRTPERLSTVPEVASTDEIRTQTRQSPPMSRRSSRSHQRRPSSSAASDKANKRRVVEQAEDQYRQNSLRARRNNPSIATATSQTGSSSPHSRQSTPPQGLVPQPPPQQPSSSSSTRAARVRPPSPRRKPTRSTSANDRRDAILKTLQIISSVSRTLYVPSRHASRTARQRMV